MNLGYVLNVIENPSERSCVLKKAFALSKEVLIVSVLATGQETAAHSNPYGDGFITKTGTFQKFFAPYESEDLIESLLDCEPVTLALGVCLVFRKAKDREAFLAARTRRRFDWTELSTQLRFSQPKKREKEVVSKYELNHSLMDSFWSAMLSFGRVPQRDEFSQYAEVKTFTGGIAKAARIALDYHGGALLEKARKVRQEDILVYLAMKNFEKRFSRRDLPERTKRDIKSFWGDFNEASRLATELLFASGDPDELQLAVDSLKMGLFDPNEGHFTFHRSLMDELPAILRIFVFCGLRRFGELEEVDLLKIHIRSGKLTLHSYDDFSGKPLPELRLRTKIDLRKNFVTIFDHTLGEDRQLLFFKERFVGSDFKFQNNAKAFSNRLATLGIDQERIGYGPGKKDWENFIKAKNLTPSLSLAKP